MARLSVDDRFLPAESWDITLGMGSYAELIAQDGGKYRSGKGYTALVKSVGAQLAAASQRPSLPFAFTVTNGAEGNAWCLPGGKVGIQHSLMSDMFKETDSFGVGNFSPQEKLAGVLAHEISHATLRHGIRTWRFALISTLAWMVAEYAAMFFIYNAVPLVALSLQMRRVACVVSYVTINIIQSFAKLWFSRSNELEADKESIYTLIQAGYNPKVAIWVYKFFASKEKSKESGLGGYLARLGSTHPDSARRAEINARTIAEITAHSVPALKYA